MMGFTKCIILVILLALSVQVVSAFSVSSVSIDPSGDMRPGTSVIVSYKVDFSAVGDETFPSSSSLQMITDLDSPKWTWTLLLNGVENPRPQNGEKMVELSGFDLSYPSDIVASIRVTLEGKTPSVTSTSNKSIIKIQEVDSRNNVQTSSKVEYTRLIVPKTIPTTVPTAAPSISNVLPTSAAMGDSVTMTIYGSGFQNGATVKLVQAGYPPVTANGVSVSSNRITCTFNLGGLQKGYANVRVTNPDGQYGDIENVFSIGETTSVGTLSIEFPAGAHVYIDGVFQQFSTPKTLPPGTYTVRVSLSGYNDYTTTTTVYAGQTTTVSAILNHVPTPTTVAQPAYAQPVSQGDSGSSNPSDLILIIEIVVGMVVGGYIVYFLIIRSKKRDPLSSPTVTSRKGTVTDPKPELTLALDHTQLIADDWDRMTIQLANRGNAHVKDVRLTFSDEFDTKSAQPATVNAGETISLDIGIRPKVKGKIPLEVTIMCRDVNDKKYRKTQKFWINVVDRMSISPVSSFTPKPLTPHQPPAELSERYTDWEFIGKGGFARVFKAKRKDGQFVAVKIPISLDESTGKTFIAEMQNWTKLDHPNIVKVSNFNIMPSPYFEMELCDSSLAEVHKPVEAEEAAWLIFNICEGLKFTHAQKIIHRDLKPQNILLKNGVPKISDWGLSRVITESTSTTAASFTPNYAAPEQIGKKAKDERTDIWQLGVIFYELVTGQLPFTGDSMVEVMSSIATKNPTLPSAINPSSHDVEAMIMKCLEKNPNKRYQSVLEFQKDLALYLRVTYTESLKQSVTAKDYNQSAYYCGDLVMVNLLTGDMKSAYKYLLDFVHYSKGDVKAEAQELSEQMKIRMEMGVTEIPDELITKAEIIVHQVRIGSEKWDNNKNGLDSLFE